ncbi:GNAT family N-acetyltransferase [Rapidithrix thailandica]|uniref:GNAT family N-acetyltransferase n=1 Tax=Rapidithrix thailandica TaxID=413964 RepID=A0AAW9S4F0_9BACT
MTIELIPEFQLDPSSKTQIANLLKACFPEEEFHGRTYFKQLPHYRLVMKEGELIVGQLGLDYRVMSLGGQPINVLGVIDVTILPELQGQGLGTKLMKALGGMVSKYTDNVDFILLIAEKHQFYENCGYTLVKQKVKWLTIEEHINYGLQENEFEDCIMIKQVGKKEWKENAELDMFGYWY